MKKHATAQGNLTNKARRLDREYENASGVSPIRARNEIDLFGLKCGINQNTPILVENVNKIPEPVDYVDPEMLRKMGYARSPLKNSQHLNLSAAGQSPYRQTAKKNTRPQTAASSLQKSPSQKLKFNGSLGMPSKSPGNKSSINLSQSFQRRSAKDKLVITNKG